MNNSNAEEAASWLFAHMEDANIHDPLPSSVPAISSSTSATEFSVEALTNLEAMGFETARCKFALKQTQNNVERAVEWLFSHMDDPLPDDSRLPGL